MSEFFSDCKRLREMIKNAFELEGIRPYNDAEVEEEEAAYHKSRHDIESKRRAQLLLNNPSLLKCLSMPEVHHIRMTGLVPDDLTERLEKQLKIDAEEVEK